jgi:hypothetical protein
MNKYVRSAVYAVVMVACWGLGTLYGKSHPVAQQKYCLLVNKSVNLELNNSYALVEPLSGSVLAIFRPDELPEVLKDPRVEVQVCKKESK